MIKLTTVKGLIMLKAVSDPALPVFPADVLLPLYCPQVTVAQAEPE